MKRFIAISAAVLVMTGCSASAVATPIKASAVASKQVVVHKGLQTKTVRPIASKVYSAKLQTNTRKLNKVVRQLKGRVHKTWYVFSGATPRGWDCSGLTLWAYEQLGVNLEHRASKQQHAGTMVETPKIGDIVVFTYKGLKSAYHVGIYVGNGKMVHAGKRGQATSVESISKFAGKYSNVSYRRIIETI